MRTTARRDGDHYVLNGTKIFITNGPIADVVLRLRKDEPRSGATDLGVRRRDRHTRFTIRRS